MATNSNKIRTFAHGTTLENAYNIAKIGFGNNLNFTQIWNCSDKDMTYFREFNGNDDTDYIIDMCIENGQIAAAIQGSTSKKIAVIIIEIPEYFADEIIEPDDSCENMQDCIQILNTDLNEYIISHDIKMHIDFYEDSYLPLLRPLYLTGLLKNSNMTIDDDNLYQAVDMIKNCDIDNDAFYEHGYINSSLTDINFTSKKS